MFLAVKPIGDLFASTHLLLFSYRQESINTDVLQWLKRLIFYRAG